MVLASNTRKASLMTSLSEEPIRRVWKISPCHRRVLLVILVSNPTTDNNRCRIPARLCIVLLTKTCYSKHARVCVCVVLHRGSEPNQVRTSITGFGYCSLRGKANERAEKLKEERIEERTDTKQGTKTIIRRKNYARLVTQSTRNR